MEASQMKVGVIKFRKITSAEEFFPLHSHDNWLILELHRTLWLLSRHFQGCPADDIGAYWGHVFRACSIMVTPI